MEPQLEILFSSPMLADKINNVSSLQPGSRLDMIIYDNMGEEYEVNILIPDNPSPNGLFEGMKAMFHLCDGMPTKVLFTNYTEKKDLN